MNFLRPGFLVLAALLCLASARMRRSSLSDQAQNFIGATTNRLSTAILQSYMDDESNLAFSPFGFSAILAILAEGAKGATLNELRTALKLPDDADKVRNAYQSILKKFHNTNEYKLNQPEFKNWFYVYKNYTVDEAYKAVLEKYYLTDVKSVKRYDADFFKPKKEEKKADNKEDKKEESSIKLKEASSNNDRDVLNFEQIQGADKNKPAEEHKDDKKPGVEGENPNNKKKNVQVDVKKTKDDDEKIISFAMEDKPAKDPTVKLVGEEKEIMEVAEAKTHGARKAKNMGDNKGEAIGLSANRVGNKESHSLMILFNGMYFRGTWKTPFRRLENAPFYTKADTKRSVPMMRAKGNYRMGPIPGLSSNAVEIPYEAGDYSLIVVKPKERAGLKKLCEDLTNFPLYDLPDMLYQTEASVTIPIFYVETTTKPLAALAEFGVGSIFSPKAELSGISPVEGLFVQEMVQHASIKIDDSDTNVAQISASNPSDKDAPLLERSQPLADTIKESAEEFIADHPFLYFVRDVKENVIVTAGKVYNPMQEEPLVVDPPPSDDDV